QLKRPVECFLNFQRSLRQAVRETVFTIRPPLDRQHAHEGPVADLLDAECRHDEGYSGESEPCRRLAHERESGSAVEEEAALEGLEGDATLRLFVIRSTDEVADVDLTHSAAANLHHAIVVAEPLVDFSHEN